MKSVAIFSLKGGVGKSACAVNLAHVAATSGGRRTLLWDLDSQGAATFLLRLAPVRGARARAALMGGDMPLADLVLASAFPRLDVLPADRSLRRLEGDLAQAEKLKLLRRHLKALGDRYDRILIDCPPGLSELADRLFRAVDLIVMPVIPTPLSDRAAAQLADELARHHDGRPPVLPVWSMVDRRKALHRETVASDPGRPAIPYSAVIEAMAVHQSPVGAIQPGGAPARAFAGLWAAVEQKLLALP